MLPSKLTFLIQQSFSMHPYKVCFYSVLSLFCILNIVLFIVNLKKKRQYLTVYFSQLFPFYVPIIILLCVLLVGNLLLSRKENGPGMDQQIQQQFNQISSERYDTVILGNSRLYRGINPELLKEKTYNFAFDNDSFLECYYKLDYLKRIDRLPETVLLGVDYFEFSFVSAGMQSTYDAYFDATYDEVLRNCSSLEFAGISKLDDKIGQILNDYFIKNYYNALSYIYERCKGNREVSFVSACGQYRIFPQPKASVGDFLTRSSVILPEQQKAYEDILSFCSEKDIKLILIMLPLRDIELDCYSRETIETFDALFAKNQYLNYAKNASFGLSDYMDDTHLNLKGADKFTALLRENLENIQ